MTSCTLNTLDAVGNAHLHLEAKRAALSTDRSWHIAIRWAAAGALIAGAVILWLLIQDGAIG